MELEGHARWRILYHKAKIAGVASVGFGSRILVFSETKYRYEVYEFDEEGWPIGQHSKLPWIHGGTDI